MMRAKPPGRSARASAIGCGCPWRIAAQEAVIVGCANAIFPVSAS